MLSEFVRILRPDGYLVLCEHDCKKEHSLTVKYINFIHVVMMISRVGESADTRENSLDKNEVEYDDDFVSDNIDWKEQKSDIIKYTNSIQYRTRIEWQQKLKNVGFCLKATLGYDQSKSKNFQELYYSVFQLIVK
ncbi:unnamed protein product [Rotaria sordida]|uniref:Methyltransferase n=1 Tax=Rotaria sordida TaxID=392033 RepID=A0A815TGS5_9BILA|nr:unnamed protein product [Rotaria sordida]CAF1500785.1 unnamed protein product [Rotaria sordida]